MTQPKHILHVFPTFAVGGSQMRFAQLVHLHVEKYKHTVIALDGNFGMAERLQQDRAILKTVEYDKHNFLGSIKIFRSTLQALNPDILMTYNWGAIEWAVANRLGRPIRHLHVEDGFGPEEASVQLRRRAWARRLALAGSHSSVILPSQTLEVIARTVWKLSPLRLNYIPNGIDHARFAGRSENVSDVVTIGTVATLRREKNIGRLIDAFMNVRAALPSHKLNLLIVGDGPERKSLERFAYESGISDCAIFTGATRRPEDWLRKMDIFALSSDTEQMPLGILEAMATGLPVVATDVGDIKKMVAEPNLPFVVEPGTAFQVAIETLVSSSSLRRSIGAENARRAAEVFDEKTMADRYAELMG